MSKRSWRKRSPEEMAIERLLTKEAVKWRRVGLGEIRQAVPIVLDAAPWSPDYRAIVATLTMLLHFFIENEENEAHVRSVVAAVYDDLWGALHGDWAPQRSIHSVIIPAGEPRRRVGLAVRMSGMDEEQAEDIMDDFDERGILRSHSPELTEMLVKGLRAQEEELRNDSRTKAARHARQLIENAAPDQAERAWLHLVAGALRDLKAVSERDKRS